MQINQPKTSSEAACLSLARLGAFTVLILVLVLALLVLPASATTLFWNGTGTSWNTVGSWSTLYTATTPNPAAVPGLADTALFNISGVNSAQSVYLDGNQLASALTFSNTSTTTLLGGSSSSPAPDTLTLGTNGSALTIVSVTANAGNVTIGDASGGGATVTPILAGPTNNLITVASGRILNLANGLNFNTGKIQNNGAGTLVLNAAGSGSGLVTPVAGTNYNIIARLDSGTVTLGNSAAFGTGVVDSRNETLQCSTDLSGANKILNTMVLATGTNVIGGSTNLELGGQYIVSNGSGNPGIMVNNTAATTISGNVYLSDASGTGKTLQFLGAAGPLTISGSISNYTAGTGTAGSLIKSGSGTLILSGINNAYSGGTTIGTGGGAAVIRAAATQALGTGTITFDTTGNASSARLELTNGITLTNNITFSGRTPNATVGIESGSGNNTLSGNITDSTGGSIYIIQSDAGLLTLGTAGATAINAVSGTRTNTLQGAGNGSVVGNIINGAGAVGISKAGTGTWTLSGSNTYSIGTFISAGTLVMANTNALGSSNVVFSGTVNATLDVATDGSDYTNLISAGSGTIFTVASDVKTGTVGINHNLGTFSIGSGATPLQLNVISGPNVASGSPQITAPLLLSGGSGGTTIINPTTAAMIIPNVTATVTSKTLQLDGTNTGNAITGTLGQGGFVISVVKANTGTWTLGGANTYTGTTTVSNGSLVVTGSTGSNTVTVLGGRLAVSGTGMISNGTPIVVSSAGTFDVSAETGFMLGSSSKLGGSGVINGNFADSSGSQILPGGSGTIGTLTFNNNLTLAGGDTLQFNLSASSNSVIAVGGNLTPGGTPTIINLASGANGLPNGNYVLFLVTNNLNGSAANFTVTGQPTPSRQTFSVVYNTATSPKQVLLQVSGSSANLTWNPTSSAWDIVATTNWLNGGVNDFYFDGDNVKFTDAGSSISPVLNTNVHPGSVTFNSANAYTLSGTGSIGGSTGLTKTNSGTLTIQISTNGYTGVTAFNGGVVSIASITNSGIASPIGAASSASANLAFNGGALQYTGGTAATDHGAMLNSGGGTIAVSSSSTALALNGVVAGTSGGALTTTGSGTVILAGANTYNGSTTISGGTLQVGNGGATGNLGSGSTIADNAALVVNRTGTLTLTNVITGTGSVANNNTGTLVLAATNTYTGGTIINTGLVQVVTAGGLGGTPSVFNPAQITIVGGELEASTNFNISDTNSGVTIAAAGTIGVDTGVTLAISNQIISTVSLTKALPGTLILSGSNTLAGILNVDTATATASDGALRIASTNALGGVPTINIRANQGPGSSTLQLDGTSGSVNVNPGTFTWSGRNNFVPAIENLAGDNVWDPSTVTFNSGGSYYMFQCDAGSLTLSGTFPSTAPAAGRILSFAGPGLISVTGTIQTGGCTNLNVFVTNNATLTLWGGNSYTGLTSVQGGTLNAADGSSFGTSSTNIELAPYTGETATLNISNATVTAQRIIIAGITANTGTPGTATVNQLNGTVSASQWVTVGSGGSSGGTGTYNLINGTLNVQNTAGGTQLEVANFTGSSGTLNIFGSSSLNIQNSAYIALGANAGAGNGTVNQYGGTVSFSGASGILYLGKASGLTSNYNYNLDGGTLTVPTITSASGNSLFYLNGGTLQATKTNTAFMSGLTAAYVSTNASILDDGGFPVTIPQPLLHDPALGATADGGLTKQNSGTLTLAATNTYTGPTTISSGSLWINGSLGAGAVAVSGGILGGAGAVNGPVDIQPGGTLAPGTSIGRLNLNNTLAFESGSTAQFNFGTGTNSTAVVAGAVNVNGSTTMSINYINAITAVGTYNLIQYGSLTGFANLTQPTSPNPRFTFTLVNNTSAKAVQLVVSGNPAGLVWQGDGVNNYWDNTGGYENWLNGGTPDYFYDGDTVLFNNAGSDTPSIYLTATVSPASVTVNATQNYDFAGSGIIAGPGGLTKNGSGTLTNEDNNTYLGATVINAGTLQIGAGNSSGTLGAGVVTNNASLVMDRSDSVVLASPIYGSGTVTMAGGGTVTASGSNYYTGATFIDSGITYLLNAAGLGATNGGITVASGAQLYITAGLNIGAAPLTLNGVGDGNGALRSGGAAATTYNGAVTLASNTTVTVDGSATLTFANTNVLNGAAANASLTLAGGGTGIFGGPLALGSGGLTVSAGTWTLATNNSFTGLSALSAGTLRINDASLGQPASFTANQITLAGGILEAQANASFIDGKAGFTLTANSTLMVDSGATLTISNNITGANNLTKTSPGTLVLNGSNAFTGTLYVDSASNTANDGNTRIASTNALANIPATPGTPTIYQNNNNSGSSTLQLDGTAGNLNLPQEIRMSCRNVAVANLENLAGSNTMSGNIDINSGGGAIYFQSDTNSTLNISGNIQYLGTLNGSRTYNFTGAGNHLVSGSITGGINTNATINVAMSGTGILTLAGANTYSNATTVTSGTLLLTGSITSTGGVTVSGGVLGGTGTISDNVSVGASGTLSPGAPGLGTLTINSNLTLAGTTYVAVSKTLGASDQVAGLTSVTYGGTLFATNLAGTLTTNDSFAIFSTAAHSQNFTAIAGSPGTGLAWSFNPATGVLGVVSAVPALSSLKFTGAPVISGTTLTISATNTGAGTVYLLTSTNLATPLNAWTPIWTNQLSGSGSFTTNLPNAAHPAFGQQFYLLGNSNN